MKSNMKYKQVIVIRTDLGMSVGKIAVQAAHASQLSLEIAQKLTPDVVDAWYAEGYRKIVCKVASLEKLVILKDDAERVNLPSSFVMDMGLTEIEPDTITAIGIGPARSEVINPITKELEKL